MVTLFMLVKTFFFLRIFMYLSYIVTMMKVVFSDLKVFMLFYLILIKMFSIIFGILKVGNHEIINQAKDDAKKGTFFPNYEY